MLMTKTYLYHHLVSFKGGSSVRRPARVYLPLLLGWVFFWGGGGGVLGVLWFFFSDTDFKTFMCSFSFSTLIYLMLKKPPSCLYSKEPI